MGFSGSKCCFFTLRLCKVLVNEAVTCRLEISQSCGYVYRNHLPQQWHHNSFRPKSDFSIGSAVSAHTQNPTAQTLVWEPEFPGEEIHSHFWCGSLCESRTVGRTLRVAKPARGGPHLRLRGERAAQGPVEGSNSTMMETSHLPPRPVASAQDLRVASVHRGDPQLTVRPFRASVRSRSFFCRFDTNASGTPSSEKWRWISKICFSKRGRCSVKQVESLRGRDQHAGSARPHTTSAEDDPSPERLHSKATFLRTK